MKASKGSLIFLGVLLVGMLLVVYYMFFYQPAQMLIDQAKLEVEEKKVQLDTMNAKILSEKEIDKQIKEKSEKVRELAKRFFVDLEQEEALEISSGQLNERQQILFDVVTHSEHTSEESSARVIKQNLDYSTDYHTLMEYLRKLRRYDKNIAVRSIALTLNRSVEDGAIVEELDTQMALDFVVIPSLEALGSKDEILIRDALSGRDLARGPFALYEGYVDPLEKQLQTPMPDPSFPDPMFPGPTEPQVPEKPKYIIYEFEDKDAFFVGSDADIGGSLIRSKSRTSGGFSMDLSFDFFVAKDYNAANLVFGQGMVMLPRNPEKLTMQIYSYENSNHNIGLHLIDGSGKEYNVEVVNKVDWLEWKEVEIKLPEGITYPCVVRRIYIEGIGYSQKLRGRYLFDQMQVQYAE
ncbi:MAG: hypothetical protein Q4A52_06730 [Bacillota bacterium]|nr:hypothetical protein [Bacillota bacterium]